MRCKQCGGSFRFSAWIIQCGECKDQYCTKCMKRQNGICYCEKCCILIKRPPEIEELMRLKAKDLQEYLNRHNVATYGVVEKRELVEILCRRQIPVRNTKSNTVLNKLYSNFESVLSFPDRLNAERRNRPPYASTSDIPTTPSPPPPPTTSSSTLPKRHPPPVPRLREYKTEEELTHLSSKELKLLLSFNRVDYKGCVEKGELLEKAQRLWREERRDRDENLPDEVGDLCKLCMDAPLDCVLLECGHIATCIACGKQLAECPICRQYVSRVVRTFKA